VVLQESLQDVRINRTGNQQKVGAHTSHQGYNGLSNPCKVPHVACAEDGQEEPVQALLSLFTGALLTRCACVSGLRLCVRSISQTSNPQRLSQPAPL
jgi:hypothetical protein